MVGRNAVQDAIGAMVEPETTVKFGRTKNDTTRSAFYKQCGQPGFDQGAADSLTLQIGCNRNRSKAEPLHRSVRNLNGRKCDVPHDSRIQFGNEG